MIRPIPSSYRALLGVGCVLLLLFSRVETEISRGDPLPSRGGLTPASDATLFRILAWPVRTESGNWRVSWESEAGRRYAVQRWNGGDLLQAGEPRWVEVTTVLASGPVTYAEDMGVEGAGARFYRVALMPLSTGGDSIEILGAPMRETDGWVVTWTSVPGRVYALERWTGADLGVRGEPLWTEVARVAAEGLVTSAKDGEIEGVERRYYRVAMLGDAMLVPVVSSIQATEATIDGDLAVELSVGVSSVFPVETVEFLDGEVELGTGAFDGARWRLTVRVNPDAPIKPYYIVRATDGSGRVGYSPVLRYGLKEVDRFAVVDENGQPTGEFVEAGEDGSLPPFEYRPTGRSSMGSQRELSIRFPVGARLVEENGQEYIEFEEAEASFGEESPMRFLSAGDGASALRPLGKHDGVKRIPVGPLAMEVLAEALGFDPAVGIPVMFFDKFPMLWRGGTLVDYGIRDPQFQFMDEGTPLPAISGGYPDYDLNLVRDRNVRLPFAGRFELPDGSGSPIEVNVPVQQPVWVTLSPEGKMRMNGRAELDMPGGGHFRGSFRFDDPFYRFQIQAESVHLPLIGSLSDLLPPNPQVCVPALIGHDQLTAATDCLESHAMAYANFSASALALTPSAEGTDAPGSPPSEFETVTSLVEAWAYSAVTPGLQSLPVAQIRALLRQIGQSASSSREMTAVLRYQLALLRAKQAVANGAIQGSAEAEQELEAALAEAEAAALSRAQEPDAMRNLEDMQVAAAMLVDIEAIRQELELPAGELLTEVAPALLQQFAGRYLEELGVRAGEYTSESNPVIGEMNRFVVHEHLSKLVSVLGDLLALGVETGVHGPLAEALSQLALRLYATATAGLNAAEAVEDVPGFTYAFADLLDLLVMMELGLFPEHPSLETIPPTSVAASDFGTRLNTLLEMDLAKPRNERSFVNVSDEIRRLLRILQQVPATVTFASPPIKRVHDFMEAALGANFTLLSANSKLGELLELLEGGTWHARLTRQFDFAVTKVWETERLPAVASRLAEQGREQRGWSELHRGALLLIREADRIEEDTYLLEAERLNLRLAYTQQAALLLVAAREAAVAIWQSEESRRAQDPLLFVTDLLLPGDIHVDEVAGSAWYDRSSRQFGGSFKGQVRLPKYGGSLTVLKSSFNSGGALDLSCYGTVSMPGGQVRVSSRFPLQLSYSPPNDLRMRGAVDVALDNGMAFGGHLILDDPWYGFGLEARGLRLDLAKELTLLRPTLDAGAVDGFDTALRRALAEYQASLSATLENLVSVTTDLPVVDESVVGEVPEFEPPQVTLPFEELNAWVNGVLFEAERGANVPYGATMASAKESLQWLNDQAREGRESFDTEIRVLDNQLRRVEARRRSARAFEKAAESQALGNDDLQELKEEADDGLREEIALHAELLRPESMQDLGEALKHAVVLMNLAASQQLLETDLSGVEPGQAPDDPTIPPSGPCREVYGATANPLLQATLLLDCARSSYFPQIGLDPNTGEVADVAVFNALSEYEVEKIASILTQVEALGAMFSIDSPAFRTALLTLNHRRHTLLTEELQRTPPDQKVRRVELSLLIARATKLAAILSDTSIPVTSGSLEGIAAVKDMSDTDMTDLDRVVEERMKVREDRLEREIIRDLQLETAEDIDPLLEVMEPKGLVKNLGILVAVIFEDRGEKDEVYLERVNSYVRLKAKRMRDRSIDPDFLNARLHDGLTISSALADMTGWALENMPDDLEFATDLEVTLQNVTLRFTTLAEARRAWWLLQRYAEVTNNALADYGEGMSTTLRAAYQSASTETLLAGGRVTEAFAALLDGVELESVVFKLPGDLVVRRVFGSVLYNRQTELLSGKFGGRIEFPEVGAFFEIQEAALASDGSFSIQAGSGGPLPFGSGVSVTADIAASGDGLGALAVSGTGEMRVESEGEVQTFAVTVGYSTVTQLLSFDSEARDLNLRFTDDFVLYGAGLGFEVSTAQPAGRLVISGSAGVLAKSKPLPEVIVPELFHVNVLDTSVSAELDVEGFAIALERGTVQLPELFTTELCTNNVGGLLGPSAILRPDQPLFVGYQRDPELITFGGQILFADLGFEVPGIEQLKVSVCTASLTFANNQIPVLSDLTASLQVPLPNETVIIDLADAEWDLSGFPIGTLQLRSDVALFNAGGFRLDVLGTESQLCPEGTALTLANDNGQPVFRVDGGLRFAVPAEVLADEAGGELFTSFCAGVDFGANLLPQLEVSSIAIGTAGSNFRLGGADGLLIRNASLQAEGIVNLFNQAPERPFILTLSGGFEIPDGPGFALQNARFTFLGEPFPRFSLGGASLSSGDSLEELTGLPIRVSNAGFSFKDQELPITELFNPENMVITLSASLGLPPEDPVISGQVQNLTVTLENGEPQVTLSGIGMGIEGFEVPPLSLTGQVFIGGLGPDEDIYFAGIVGGSLQGAGVKALVAFNLRGPLGVCFSVNAGPAGIPLGQTGFLFTGAEGGVSFLNTNGDPCDFQTFINVGEDGVPVDNSESVALARLNLAGSGGGVGNRHAMTWEELRLMRQRYRLYEEAAAAGVTLQAGDVLNVDGGSSPAGFGAGPYFQKHDVVVTSDGPEFPCPTGDCPPETINILCQLHPDLERYPDRVIVKFSSLDEPFVNDLGVTREFIESLGLTTAEEIATEVAARFREAIDAITPRPDPGFMGPGGEPLGAELNALLDNLMVQLEGAFRGAVQSGIQGVLGDSESVYGAILEAAYAGVGCPDATVKLTGTFSHLAVSSFLSGTGGGILSTTGSAGLVGTVNLFGVPVGFLDGFVNATDAKGDPNPSMCGVVRFAVGPLDIGQLRMLNECEGCMTGVLNAFGGLAGCLGDEVFNAVLPKVAPELLGMNKLDAMLAMTDPQKLAFLAEWFSLPPTPGTAECFLELVVNVLGSINPEFTLCGAVQPKLFGFPLAGSAIEVAAAADKTSMAGQFSFSSALLMGSYAAFFPIGDQATFGFGVAWPNPDDLIIGALTGRFNSPEAMATYVEEGFAHVLENATYTVGFELSPFGLKGFQSGARVVMPNLTEHPEVSGWVAPEDRNSDLPSRLELLIAAVENGLLDNALWKGTAEDIHLAFPADDPRRARVQGLSFSKDYFPHGGVVGAARLGLPRAIIETPPESLSTILDPTADLPARLAAAMDYVQNYILDEAEVGTLGFYVPAPNPPIFTDGQGNELSPRELLDQILQFDPALGLSTDLYPLHASFLHGYLDGQLLGVPIARAQVTAIPPGETSDGQFLILTEIPEGSWMKSFIESAGLTFEVRQSPPRSIEENFTLVAEALELVMGSNLSDAAKLAYLSEFIGELQSGLPKVSLDLAVNNFRIPTELEAILQLDGSSSARLVAYTPQFEPEATGNNPMTIVRRQGGVALQARLRFADLVTIDHAELGVFPGRVSALTGLPSLAGLFDVPLLPLGFGLSMRDVLFEFNSEPAVGSAYVAASGGLDPIQIGPLLRVTPLNNGDSLLGGNLRVLRTSQALPATQLSVNPARIEMPLFAEGLNVLIHGSSVAAPFTFSTDSEWLAGISLEGGLVLRDLASVPVLRIGSEEQMFSALIEGDGVESASMTLELPTGIEITVFPGAGTEQTMAIGAVNGRSARLTVGSDGSFLLEGGLEANLALSGLPIQSLQAGATIAVTATTLTLTGTVSGGSLDGVNTGSASATLVITRDAVVLNGTAVVPPIQLGNFRISALDGGSMIAVVDQESLRISSGARLAIQGITEDLLTLNAFVVAGNGDFTVSVSSGDFAVGDFFALSQGTTVFRRLAGVAQLEVTAPRMRVFPGTPHSTLLPTALEQLLVASNGQIYYDSGTQSINLPHTFAASGRLEFGWEPDANAPVLAVNAAPVQFGLVDTGSSVTRTLRVSNTGGSQLVVASAVDDTGVFGVEPILVTLGPGQFADLLLRFSPNAGTGFAGSLQLTHNTVTSPTTISLNGAGRAVPIYYQSADELAFGDQPVGGGALRQVFISNLGKAPLEIESVTIDPPFTGSSSGFVVDPGESRRLFVTFEPESVGEASGTMTIQANDDVGTHVVALSGMGSQLRWYVQRDGGSTLRSVDSGVAVGDNGSLLMMGHDGDRLTARPALGTVALRRVYRNPNGFGSTYAVGRSGTVLRFGSNQWTPVTDPVVASGGNQFNGVATYWPSHLLLLVGERGLIIRETIGAFTAINSGTLDDLHDVAFSFDAVFGLIVGADGTLLRSTTQGASWVAQALPAGVNGVNLTLRAVDVNAGGVSLVVGDFGTILRSASNGLGWIQVNNVPTDRNLFDVRMVGSNAYAVGDSGVFMRSGDAGLTWQVEGTAATTHDLFGVWVSDDGQKVWTVGQGGFMQHRPVAAPAGPIFSTFPQLLDFGTIALGDTKKMTAVIRNPGTDTLVISSIQGGDLFTPGQTSMTVPPGGQGLLSVVFHPAAATDTDPHQPTRVIVFETNLPESLQYLQVRGLAKANAWRQIPSATDQHLTGVRFVSETVGYAIFGDGVIKTVDGGLSWTNLPNVNASGTIRVLHFFSATSGMIAGGDGNSRFVRRTTNGGASWTDADLAVTIEGGPITGISFTPGEESRGYATTASAARQGMVLRTLNAGASWAPTPVSRPFSTFSGGAIYSYTPFRVYVSSGGALYRSIDSGSSWSTIFDLGGALPIQTIRTVGLFNGFLGGVNGLFRRTSNADATPPVWTGAPVFTAATIQDISFVSQERGWLVTGGASSGGISTIYRTEDGGTTWKEEYSINDGNILSVWGVGSGGNLAYAVGARGRVWKFEPFSGTPVGVASVPETIALGEVDPGERVAFAVNVLNVGPGDLQIRGVILDNHGEVQAFTVEETGTDVVAPGEGVELTVFFEARSSGNHTATLTIMSDGAEQTVSSSLSARVVAPPQVVVLDTEPSGLGMMVDGMIRTAPVAFTVFNEPGDNTWAPGSVHEIGVAEEQSANGVAYRFQQWDPVRERQFELTASGAESVRFVARYVPSVVGMVQGADSVLQPSDVSGDENGPLQPANVEAPEDVPAGPWLRLSNASLVVPALGNVGLQGAVFLSPNHITASLDSQSFRMPADPDAPELLEVSAGSWRLDYARIGAASLLVLRAQAPGVTLFDQAAVPPSELTFNFEPNGHFQAAFATQGTTPVLPGIFELGPGAVQLSRNPFYSLSVNGQVRLLKTPDGSWALNEPLEFVASEGPFEHVFTNLPDPLLGLGFMSLDPGTAGAVRVSRNNSGVFSVGVENLGLSLFGRSFANMSGTADGSGLLTLVAAPPATPYEIGPMRYEVTQNSTVTWNVLGGDLDVSIPAGKLKAAGVVGWPSNGVDFPGFSVDSGGDFERRINLPTFTFNGMSLVGGGNVNDNHVLFKRQNGVVSLRVRDERDFFGNEFKLAFDVASTGNVSGFFSGQFTIVTPVFGELNFGSVSLSYDDARTDYQFQNRFGLVGNEFGIFFGSSGGQFSHLNCDGPTLEDCEPGLFSIGTP